MWLLTRVLCLPSVAVFHSLGLAIAARSVSWMLCRTFCYLCTGNPVDHTCWSLPFHLPSSLPKPDLVMLCGKFREAQVGWTQLPARLLRLGFCFGQAIKFFAFFWKEYIDEWFEYAGGLIAWGLRDWLEESVVAFQLILASTGSVLLCQSRGFLNCTKGTHPPWW